MKKQLDISLPVLVDEMDNRVWCTYGPAPDMAYLIDTDGTVLLKQCWYQPGPLEEAFKSYLSAS